MSFSSARFLAPSFLVWSVVVLAGGAAPVLAMLMLGDALAGPILALGLMGAGMIGAAAAGRLWIGLLLALLAGAGLVLLARALGMPGLPHPVSTGLAFIIASFSFAARGSLFARSAADKGWWIAVFVVGGEAAMLGTALALPGALPDWLLVLLPAQWASMAIQAGFSGNGMGATGMGATGTGGAGWALLALAGTGAVTLLVARLWPRRWPYLLMFMAWLGLSALVWHRAWPPMPRTDLAGGSVAAGLAGE